MLYGRRRSWSTSRASPTCVKDLTPRDIDSPLEPAPHASRRSLQKKHVTCRVAAAALDALAEHLASPACQPVLSAEELSAALSRHLPAPSAPRPPAATPPPRLTDFRRGRRPPRDANPLATASAVEGRRAGAADVWAVDTSRRDAAACAGGLGAATEAGGRAAAADVWAVGTARRDAAAAGSDAHAAPAVDALPAVVGARPAAATGAAEPRRERPEQAGSAATVAQLGRAGAAARPTGAVTAALRGDDSLARRQRGVAGAVDATAAAAALCEEGYLARRQRGHLDLYHITLPNSGPIAGMVVAARAQIVAMLKRRKLGEAPEQMLLQRKLSKSALGWKFHLQDLVGRGTVQRLVFGNNVVYQLVAR